VVARGIDNMTRQMTDFLWETMQTEYALLIKTKTEQLKELK
jgi:hypothetical protein